MDGRKMVAGALAAAAMATIALAAPGKEGKGRDASQVARGKYLVEQVAMCGDCHAPRDGKGQFLRDRWLQGAALDFKNTVPMPAWAEVAPPIAGLPGWTQAQIVTLLTTGKDQKGLPADPPMPQYRMTREDAAAVAAYLATLPSAPKD